MRLEQPAKQNNSSSVYSVPSFISHFTNVVLSTSDGNENVVPVGVMILCVPSVKVSLAPPSNAGSILLIKNSVRLDPVAFTLITPLPSSMNINDDFG